MRRLPLTSRRWLWVIVPLLTLLALSSCAQVGYLTQAVAGQAGLLLNARPIPRVLADPATSPELRRKLRLAQDVRHFAVTVLGEPDSQSFLSYTDVHRPYLVWNVFSAPPLSVTLDTSCFPVAGCVPYRGYFSQAGAEQQAARLRQAGDDVWVGGVTAYSTLGRLPDPLPSTLIAGSDASLIRTIIHELAHQIVYVPGDTSFDESFAVSVETAGSARYAAARGLPDPGTSVAYTRSGEVSALLLRTRARLAQVYSSGDNDAQKLTRKQQVLDGARTEYAALKAGWNGYAGYDAWFAPGPRGLNNAVLGSVAAYADVVPTFLALLEREGSYPAFYAAVRACAARGDGQRVPCLEAAAR